MEEQEDLSKKANRLFGNIKNLSQRLVGAVREGMNEPPFDLICVRQEVLDFDSVEEDIKRIHANLASNGDVVLGSHLVLDDKQNFMEIKTYVERGDKTLLKTVKIPVTKITNIPTDILKELKKEGVIELHLKI